MMKGAKIAAGVLAMGALGATLGGIAAPAAHADGGVSTTNGAGSAWFQDHGDHLTVNDWSSDGHGVNGRILEKKAGKWKVVRHLYNGNGLKGDAAHADYNLPEHKKYRLDVCLVDGKHDGSGEYCAHTTIYS